MSVLFHLQGNSNHQLETAMIVLSSPICRVRTPLHFILNSSFAQLFFNRESSKYRSLDFAYEWVCEEPTLHSQACLSLFLLINKRVDDARTIYFNIIDHIE